MRPKKSLGQHFLIAPSYAKKIADFVPSGKDGCVLEIGPGRGALSVFLKELFPSFHLVEIDGEVIPELKAKLGAGGWTLHECNALGFDFLKAGFPLHVVGNLPYSCAAMIIRKTLLYGEAVASCTFMVQREVAERIIAGAHCKQYGFLSIFCRFFGNPRILFHVPPGVFFPKPRVDSSVFQIVGHDEFTALLPAKSWENFFRFVDLGFGMRRKTLVNALGRKFEKGICIAALKKNHVDTMARAEDLSVKEWLDLYLEINPL